MTLLLPKPSLLLVQQRNTAKGFSRRSPYSSLLLGREQLMQKLPSSESIPRQYLDHTYTISKCLCSNRKLIVTTIAPPNARLYYNQNFCHGRRIANVLMNCNTTYNPNHCRMYHATSIYKSAASPYPIVDDRDETNSSIDNVMNDSPTPLVSTQIRQDRHQNMQRQLLQNSSEKLIQDVNRNHRHEIGLNRDHTKPKANNQHETQRQHEQQYGQHQDGQYQRNEPQSHIPVQRQEDQHQIYNRRLDGVGNINQRSDNSLRSTMRRPNLSTIMLQETLDRRQTKSHESTFTLSRESVPLVRPWMNSNGSKINDTVSNNDGSTKATVFKGNEERQSLPMQSNHRLHSKISDFFKSSPTTNSESFLNNTDKTLSTRSRDHLSNSMPKKSDNSYNSKYQGSDGSFNKDFANSMNIQGNALFRSPTDQMYNKPTSSNSTTKEASGNNSIDKSKIYSSPLSEFIRAAQLKYAQQRAAQLQEDANKSNETQDATKKTPDLLDLMSATMDPSNSEPMWRRGLSQGKPISELKATRLAHSEDTDDFLRHDDQTETWLRKFKSDYKETGDSFRDYEDNENPQNSKSLIRMLPPYEISLAEASQLLRERSNVLRKILHSLGIETSAMASTRIAPTGTKRERRAASRLPSTYTTSIQQMDDEDIMIDTDTMELLAMELCVPFQRASRVRSRRQNMPTVSDKELLMQRRSMAAQVQSTDTINNDIDESTSPYQTLPPRPPVVCIMGHVDHGKTTLMDSLRKRSAGVLSSTSEESNKKKKNYKAKDTVANAVAGTEAGGITQVISAFQVKLTNDDRYVTFLDTPGHAAFKCMRQSGSDAADVIVLVIAAEDGVSQQTVEVLDFYKSIVKESDGSISLVVAMNKIDKPGIDVDECQRSIENQLLENGIYTESVAASLGGHGTEYGPPVQLIRVSGLTGQGLDDLIEGLLLQSEVMDLRADDTARAEGLVIDARVDKGLGVVADCIVRWGVVQTGDIVVSGTAMGKVRALKDVQKSNKYVDKELEKGLPSQPVRIIGFDSVPKAGDPIIVVASEAMANDLVKRRQALVMLNDLAAFQSSSANSDIESTHELQSAGKHLLNHEWRTNLEFKHSMGNSSHGKDYPVRIPVFIKADADGTLSAVRDAIVQLGEESKHNVQIDPIQVGVGPLMPTDIAVAKECNAIIIGFNVKVDEDVLSIANDEQVSIIQSDIIYRLLEEAKVRFASYLPTQQVDIVHGRATVKAVYDISKKGKIAGMQVIEGTLYKEQTKCQQTHEILKTMFRILRNGSYIKESHRTSKKAVNRDQNTATENDNDDAATDEDHTTATSSSNDVIMNFVATSLKHFKDDVQEVTRGNECGLALDRYEDYQEGDIIECYSVQTQREAF